MSEMNLTIVESFEGDGEGSDDGSSVQRHVTQRVGDFEVPYGYELWGDGIYHIEGDVTDPALPDIQSTPSGVRRQAIKNVAHEPVWIRRFGRTLDTGEQLVELTFRDAFTHEIQTEWVNRLQLASKQMLVKLSRLGLPVNDGNVNQMLHYLDAALHTNGTRLEVVLVAARNGAYPVEFLTLDEETGQTEKQNGYGWLVGDRWIGPLNTRVVADPRNMHTSAQGYTVSGSEEEWFEHFKHICAISPIARWLTYSTFGAPLLRFVRQRTFIVHHWGESGGGKCIDGSSLVATKSGIHRIGDLDSPKYGNGFNDIAANRRPLVWNGSGYEQASHFYKEHATRTIRLQTTRGYEIIGTPEHPIFAEGQWRRLDAIETGARVDIARLAVNPKQPIQVLEPAGPSSAHDHGQRLSASVRVDEAIGRLFGYFVADGTNTDTTNFRMTSDPEVLDDAETKMRDAFGVHGTRAVEHTGAFGTRWHHGELRRTFAAGGLDFVTAPYKRIPDVILRSPKNVIREFLRGYIECEGSFEDGRIEVSSASETLLREVQSVLLLFGLTSTRRPKIVNGETYWRLTIFGTEDLLLFTREIGVVSAARRDALGAALIRGLDPANARYGRPQHVRPRDGQETFTDTVASIEEAGERMVYDFTIPNGHAFWSNGFVSHNTALAKFAMSAWGDPARLTQSFNRTQLSFVELFRHIDDLPLTFDELQASGMKDHATLIYALCLEQGRGRASPDGRLQEQIASWRSVVRMTGEEPIIGKGGMVDLGGQANRVVQIGTPVLTQEQGSATHRWLEGRHFGWGGLRFLQGLQQLMEFPDGEQALQDKFDEFRSEIFGQLSESVHSRVLHLSIVALATYLANRWFFDMDPAEAKAGAIADAISVGKTIAQEEIRETLAEQALQLFRDHFASHRGTWYDLSDPQQQDLLATGNYRQLTGVLAPNEIWLIQKEANMLLNKAGFPQRRVWADLHRLGILHVYSKSKEEESVQKQFGVPRKFGKFHAKVYVLHRPLTGPFTGDDPHHT